MEERGLVPQIEQDRTKKIDASQIRRMVYVIRDRQVMLDADLALLYQVETKALNRQVKRNIGRFPEDFCFQLTSTEYSNLKCQFGTSSINSSNDSGHGGRRTLPYAFTEQGISMLSSVLHSEVAVNVSVGIMRTFVEMRKYMANTQLLYNQMNVIEQRQISYENRTDEKFEQIFEYIADHKETNQKVFFEGQIYDAFSVLIDLVSRAEKEIVLIDNYVDAGTLNILAKKKKNVKSVIYTVCKTKITAKDLEVFNQQYPTLQIRYTSAFHDRFLILDGYIAYHIGASLKDAGKKCFAINRLNDEKMISDIMQRVGQ